VHFFSVNGKFELMKAGEQSSDSSADYWRLKCKNVKWPKPLNGGKYEAKAELEFHRHLAISKRVKTISNFKYLKLKNKKKMKSQM
jgi:hypothetical protein